MAARSIARLENISAQDFHQRFWLPREPVVVAGGDPGLLERYNGWSADAVFERMRARVDGVKPEQLWYDTEEGVLLARGDLPEFVTAHVYGPGHLTRRRHYRLFFHPAGHLTGLHYEGNLLDVFSYQLEGRKRWRLLAGDGAHKLLPFYFVDNQATYDPAGAPPEWTYEFDLCAGEILFLPRGWYHQVECLTDDNVALSLVSAPTDVAALDARTLEIYREQLALQYHLRALLPRRFGDKLDTFITYEPSGRAWAEHYVAGVSRGAMLRRFALDLCITTPAMLGSAIRQRRTREYVTYLAGFERALRERLGRA